jgi:IS5 family transposase
LYHFPCILLRPLLFKQNPSWEDDIYPDTGGDNLKRAKARKIKDVCFAKKRGLEETEMCRSEYVYHRLRRFRAGIESGISWLKRCMGLTRCMWKGWRAFKSYVWSSIVAANLLTIARTKLAET